MTTLRVVGDTPDSNLILDSLGAPVMVVDPDSTISYVNPSAAELLGYTPAEMIHRSHLTFQRERSDGSEYPWEDCPVYESIRDNVVTKRDDEHFWRKDGSTFPVGYTSTPIRAGGVAIGAVVSFRDISRRKMVESTLIQSEAALRAGEDQYRSLLAAANDAIFIADAQTGLIVEANRRAAALLDTPLEEIVGMHQSQLHPSDQAEYYRELFASEMAKGSGVVRDVYVQRKDGSLVPVEISATITQVGDQVYMQGIFHDVSDRKAAEDGLRASEERFRALVMSSQDGTLVDIRFTLWNPAMEANSGLKSEDVLGRSPFEMFSFLDEVGEGESFRKAVRGESSLRTEMTYKVAATGRKGWFESSHFPVYGLQGEVIGGMGLIRDVTERHLSEESIRRSRENLRSTLESMDDLVFSFDKDGIYVDFYQPNKTGELYLRPEVFVGKHFLDVSFPSEMLAQLEGAFEAIQAGEGTQSFDYALQPGQEVRWYNAKLSGRRDSQGIYEGATAVIRDITSRKEAEDRAARLADESRLLLDVSQIIAGALRLDEIMTRLVDVTASLTGLGRVTVLLADKGGGLLPQASTDPHITELGTFSGNLEIMPSVSRVVADVSASHGPLVDAPADMRSMILVPFCRGGDCLGCLILDEPGEAVEFSTSQVRMAESIGRQATLAIQNARAYETQANIAGTLGRSLLPEPVTEIGGMGLGLRYVSAAEGSLIGGDFYDYFELDDGRVVVALGDISGKGLEAAIDTAMVKYALEALSSLNPTPRDLVAALNDALMSRLRSGRFATLFYAVIDPASRSLTCVNAGHPPPVIRRPDGTCLPTETTMTGGTALGILGGREYVQTEISFDPGDVMVLYTDGVSEARSAANRLDMFDIGNILRTLSQPGELSAQQWADTLFAETSDFSGGTLSDDVAVVTLLFR